MSSKLGRIQSGLLAASVAIGIAASGFPRVAMAADAARNRFQNARIAQANAHNARASRAFIKPKAGSKAKAAAADYRFEIPIRLKVARYYADTPGGGTAVSALRSYARRFPDTALARQASQVVREYESHETRFHHTIPAYIKLLQTTEEPDLIAEAQAFLRQRALISEGETARIADAAIRRYQADKEGPPRRTAAELLTAAKAPLTAPRGVARRQIEGAVENVRKIFIHFPTTNEAQEATALLKSFTTNFSRNKTAKKARGVLNDWSPRPSPARPPRRP